MAPEDAPSTARGAGRKLAAPRDVVPDRRIGVARAAHGPRLLRERCAVADKAGT
jgi:hypothetical protein